MDVNYLVNYWTMLEKGTNALLYLHTSLFCQTLLYCSIMVMVNTPRTAGCKLHQNDFFTIGASPSYEKPIDLY